MRAGGGDGAEVAGRMGPGKGRNGGSRSKYG